jgi:hypothetical protein
MKFLKSQNISKWSPSDNTLQVNPYGRVVMDVRGALMVPKGTTAQRPDLIAVRHPAAGEIISNRIPNGYIRFNVDTDSYEGYINGIWEVIKGPSANSIVKDTFGPGDGVETVFGPLDVNFIDSYSSSDDNIIVLVENVMQISTTNFTVEQSVSGSLTGPGAPYADGWYVKFTSAVPDTGSGGNPVYVTVYYGYSN